MSHAARSRRRVVPVLLLIGALLVSLAGVEPLATPAAASTPASTVPFELVEDRDVNDRLPHPEDRYALAGGCYTMRGVDGAWLTRNGTTITSTGDAAAATPLHFQATRLGHYLLATDEGPDTEFPDAWWDVRGYVTAADPLTGLLGRGTSIADRPSERADWEITALVDTPDRRVADGQNQTYEVRLPGDGSTLGRYTFHHVPAGSPAADLCAVWPEVDVSADGRPTANPEGPAAEVQGFFESHVHGMAFEFLGGRVRCGRPWHPYGVEFALVGCPEAGPDGRLLVLETVLSGRDPVAGHDTVGWPTFNDWPKNDSLTYEQYYWRWLERAYLGGLRLSVNLLVDNTALCELYPLKQNSCNEMDGVRLQAQRLFELQDYIDAQAGGPGEGWFRLVTDPVQARQVINAGRLAVVMGIEVSVLFDCGEFLDLALCTTEEIDRRLAEVYDMGVRQMELVNKFDNALSGVTGDGGETGVIVNSANRYVTGHFWDMQTCEDEGHAHDHSHLEGDEHDKPQVNFTDAVRGGERDALTGLVFEAFAPTRGVVAPAYPAGPHCNTRGLTDLGRHLVTQMIDRGMVFDPDHMSAGAMREALDHIEQVLIPAEQAAAQAEGRPARQPSLISSHSWGNDVVYQRIYELDGMIGPYAGAADSFADAWAQRREWADRLAPEGHHFGLGYGADTNGLGSQPGTRRDPAVPLDYDGGFEAPVGGVRLFQHVNGLRTHDINAEGVAHYGMFADWFQEVALSAEERHADRGGAAAVMADMLAGPESYLRMWERGLVGGGDCVADQSTFHTQDLHALLGLNVEGFLTSIGQPVQRDDSVYTYCTFGYGHIPEVVDVVFDAAGIARSVVPSSTSVGLTLPRLPVLHIH
ncbi:hypothetical protein BH23ACT9_BH23ACT9_39250 [soil metagenome]